MAAGKPNDAFGDFQTPPELASEIWQSLDLAGVDAVVEPTVGAGSFIATAPAAIRRVPWVAFDINGGYVERSRRAALDAGVAARIEVADAFGLQARDFHTIARGRTVLAIGNPPWVTSAAQGGLTETNLPLKWNRFGFRGLDAVTGRSNFDVAEAILLAVAGALQEAAELRMAFLVKRSVAVRMAKHVLGAPGVASAAFAAVDARRWFGASVEAGLLQLVLRPGDAATCERLLVARALGDEPSVAAGLVDGRFVEDVEAYAAYRAAEAPADGGLTWRQGIKHDASRVLELRHTPEGLVNGLGEQVDVEAEALCPYYKSSDVAAGRGPSRVFPLYQHDLSGPFPDLAVRWPKLAAYLRLHRERLDARGSSIYRAKPSYMLFGVGDYSLAPFKVAISGFYKQPRFTVVGPDAAGRPPLLDDTCYLLPFQRRHEADRMARYLNGDSVQGFLRAVADTTAKRPYTKDVLGRIADPRAQLAERAA